MPWNSHSQMRLLRMSQLRMTSRLVVNLKASPEQSAQNLPWFQDGQTRRHSGAYCYAKLFRPSRSFIGDGLAVLAEPLQMNPNGVGGHLASFPERSAVGD